MCRIKPFMVTHSLRPDLYFVKRPHQSGVKQIPISQLLEPPSLLQYVLLKAGTSMCGQVTLSVETPSPPLCCNNSLHKEQIQYNQRPSNRPPL